jgi:hypothetical protein
MQNDALEKKHYKTKKNIYMTVHATTSLNIFIYFQSFGLWENDISNEKCICLIMTPCVCVCLSFYTNNDNKRRIKSQMSPKIYYSTKNKLIFGKRKKNVLCTYTIDH